MKAINKNLKLIKLQFTLSAVIDADGRLDQSATRRSQLVTEHQLKVKLIQKLFRDERKNSHSLN